MVMNGGMFCESKNVLKSSLGSFRIPQEFIVKIYITPELKKGAGCWIVFKFSSYESKKFFDIILCCNSCSSLFKNKAQVYYENDQRI